jgi:hypothetical protein
MYLNGNTTMATNLQIKMIKEIAMSEFNAVDGDVPEHAFEATTWIDMVANTSETKGVFVSLCNAGLVTSDGESVTLTEAGFQIFKENQ